MSDAKVSEVPGRARDVRVRVYALLIVEGGRRKYTSIIMQIKLPIYDAVP